MDDKKALSGITVFDATQGVAGPHSTMLMAQHGANVIKVEPLDGDWGRTLGKTYGDLCAHFIAFNRGKRSLALDLKNPEGVKLAQRLAYEADVVVESFRPGVMKRFGLDYETVRRHKPDTIYLSVTGFGQEGPNNHLPVTDAVIQAFSGWMSINRDAEGSPQRVGMVAIDVVTGLYAFQALSTAILRKLRFGEGTYVDCSLMQAAAAFQSAKISEFDLEDGAPQLLYVPVGTMKTADGYLNVTAMREKHYASLCHVLGLPELIHDERYNTRDKRIEREKELMPIIRAAFLNKTTAEWQQLLTEAEVMNAPVRTYGDFLENEHVKAVDSIAWVDHDGVGRTPIANIPGLPKIESGEGLGASPHVGEHSIALLQEAGLSDAEIDGLLTAGAVTQRTA